MSFLSTSWVISGFSFLAFVLFAVTQVSGFLASKASSPAIKSQSSPPQQDESSVCAEEFVVYPSQKFDSLEKALPGLDPSRHYVFIARHGQTDMNAGGFLQGRGVNANLNDIGREQGRALGDFLKNTKFDTISCSTLIRSYETAEEILKMNNFMCKATPIAQYVDLEELSWGELEGQCAREEPWRSKFKHTVQMWREGKNDYKAVNGESPNEVAARARGALEAIVAQQQESGGGGGGRHLVVSHGRTIRSLLDGLAGVRMESVPNCGLYCFAWG
ncbi:unnamed protein product, partial [Heterosigma akashiwo]